MPDFATVAEQFRKLHCAHCQAAFTPDAVTPLRQEADYWVVRVVCTGCSQPSGVAVVGAERVGPATPPARDEAPKRVGGIFGSRKEAERFADMPAITADDVLDASQRIRDLGSDWARELRRRGL